MNVEVQKRAPAYQGTAQECKAQAARDLANLQVERIEKDNVDLGGVLLYIRVLKLWTQLGYASFDEFLSSERVGGLGKTQCYKLINVATCTAPATELAAPMLSAPQLDTDSAQLVMPPELVRQIGTERAYVLSRKWRTSSPDEREDLLESAITSNNKDFYLTAYGENDKVNFEVTGDEIILWQNEIGTPVAQFITLDPLLRSQLMDRLGTLPRAKL